MKIVSTIVRTFLGLILLVGMPVLWADAQSRPAQTKPIEKPPAPPPPTGKPKPAPPTRPPSLRLAATTPPTVGNPVAVEFEFSDWQQAIGYEVDIADAATLATRQTMKFPATSATAGTITIHLAVNVMPTAMGIYVFIARGVMPGNMLTTNSEPSDPWERKPGPPGKPVAIGK
jgi:hypothetical protein